LKQQKNTYLDNSTFVNMLIKIYQFFVIMGLSDIITTPFLLCLGICFLLIGLLGFYFMQKVNEQNHKMNSMLDLITTVATELNGVNGRIQQIHYGIPSVVSQIPHNHQKSNELSLSNNDLIPVSDDDSDDDDNSIQDSENEEDDEEEDESENGKLEEKHESNFIKSINLGGVLNFNFDDSEIHETNVEELSNDESNGNTSDLDSIESEPVEDINESEDDLSEEEIKEENRSLLKTIQMSDLEEIKESVKIDYKKFALNKLRSMVTERGLSSDASKLKKQDLIKLLEEN